MNLVEKLLLGVFVAAGGFGLLVHLALSHTSDAVRRAVIFAAERYPAFKSFLAAHGPEIVEAAMAVAEGVKEGVDAESPKPQ